MCCSYPTPVDNLTITPLGNRLILKRLEEQQQPKSIIIAPEKKSREQFYVVQALGPDVKEYFEIGDQVLVDSYNVNELMVDGVEYSITREESIIAVKIK